MKKRLVSIMLVLAMALGLVACGAKTEEPADDAAEEKELTEVTWNYGTSGNVMVTIANEMGYFEEEGIKITPVEATANADAMALLASGKVDVVSNSGTSNPLQQIAQGVDITIFGGHMIEGCMPVIALPDTEWNGVESFVGKKVAINPSYFAFTGAVMDAGYDPMNDVEWVITSGYDEALVKLQQGEVDYALQGTGQVESVLKLAEQGDIKIVAYQSDIMPNYSCCRMEAQTSWINENPDTVKAIIRALLRAQSWYETNKEEAVKLHAAATGTEESYVAAFMMDDEHYFVSADPLANSVKRAWGILEATGYIAEDCEVEIEDHINTTLYEEALKEATEKYGAEAPEFYEAQAAFFAENN